MNFFLDMIPPTVTAQEHKVMIRRGRPVFYDTPAPEGSPQAVRARAAAQPA